MSIKNFFSAARVYAVVGATPNETKFGYKVFNWYLARELPVIPVHPSATHILHVPTSQDIALAIKRANEEYPNNDGISISFITPPKVSESVLNEIETKQLKDQIKGVWFQPGAYNEEVLGVARHLGIDPIVENGDCILVSGDSYSVKSSL
ncbi:hypothetical protein BN7_165 [Wickerhamomyces ciferrii]|uniref:CoA-binding domain-containing protein n=1 Tax=Wickerhamomyces ciferrii (strain ATCC 14091 / BCRC 22168 / CBS 111 / JCM 3599 / NBRC 0793 / NRRL Y-1031 F-60-10) TaxID=1206466 RepID=K0KCK7_WICCF|nr:uncharacterized protein BN7_165 [Wickerhamomyces ciferrii]CCH40631.1 hypothetical protein BN7_165 [Wickerhamomyces ciferrii]